MDLQLLAGMPAALTAIREFHRLKARRELAQPLTLREARVLVTVRNLLEPLTGRSRADREPLMIAARRPAVTRSRGGTRRGVLVGLALRVVHVHVEAGLAPGQWVRIGIPRSSDGRWHRFRGRVLRVDGSLASIALVAPAGMRPTDREGRAP